MHRRRPFPSASFQPDQERAINILGFTQRKAGPSALEEFRVVARRCKISWTPAYAIVVLGLVAALVDAAAVSLIVMFCFDMLGQGVSTESGILRRFSDLVHAVTSDNRVALGALVIAIVIGKAALGYANSVASIRFKNRVNECVLRLLHARLLEVPYGEIRKHGQGDLINTLATDAWQVANIAYLITRVSINACMIIVFGVFAFLLAWWMALVAVLGSVAVGVMGNFVARSSARLSIPVRRRIDALYAHMLVAVYSARLVRAFAGEQREEAKFAQNAAHLRKELIAAEATQAFSGYITEIGYVSLLVVLVLAAGSSGQAEPAAFTVIALLYRLMPHVRELEDNRQKIAGLYAPLAAVAVMLDRTATRRTPSDGGAPFQHLTEPVRIEDVTFTPPGTPAPVLEGVSFEIPPGKTTALLGPSGAGKTSIVNLLLGLYAPDRGIIRVEGIGLESIDRKQWLERVALAGQDLDLIEGTIADNILFGRPHSAHASVEQAARDSGALDFINALPLGFDTWVGTNGFNLSSGQRQRIALARALLRDPELLILDEAASGVEATLESTILANIARRRRGQTILLITHRLNHDVPIDRVVRIERGRVLGELEEAEPDPAMPKREGQWR